MYEIDEIYLALCDNLLNAPVVKMNNNSKATSGETREINNVKITLKDLEHNIVTVRNISPSYLFAEWLWYFTGRNDVRFISEFGKIWKQMSDDGKTNNSAYGYIMQKKFGFDQIETIIDLLKYDPQSRRAVININTPNEFVKSTKDEPCTIALQFLIRDNKLYCTAMMRSNDIYLGFPYDVAFFTELQKYIADRLNIKCGTYTHFVVSMHLYDRNYRDVADMARHPRSKPFYFDRNKFHKEKEFVTKMVDIAILNNSSLSREILLKLAKDYFDFKE